MICFHSFYHLASTIWSIYFGEPRIYISDAMLVGIIFPSFSRMFIERRVYTLDTLLSKADAKPEVPGAAVGDLHTMTSIILLGPGRKEHSHKVGTRIKEHVG